MSNDHMSGHTEELEPGRAPGLYSGSEWIPEIPPLLGVPSACMVFTNLILSNPVPAGQRANSLLTGLILSNPPSPLDRVSSLLTGFLALTLALAFCPWLPVAFRERETDGLCHALLGPSRC